MTETELALVATLRHLIDKAIEGCIVASPSVEGNVDPDLQALAESVEHLLVSIETMRRFSVALANGEIATEAPSRNKLLGPLKSLQASLRHLTWQTKEVAVGHLDHRFDFLGEFSTAFNQMIDALRMKKRVEHEVMETSRFVGIFISRLKWRSVKTGFFQRIYRGCSQNTPGKPQAHDVADKNDCFRGFYTAARIHGGGFPFIQSNGGAVEPDLTGACG